jgi:hypothetical protein
MMKSIKLFELVAASMQSLHRVLSVVARDRIEIDELLHAVK